MTDGNDRFKKMLEESPDWFWEFDEHGIFTYASPRVKDLLGYEPEELIGLNAFDLMDADEAERVHRHFDPIARKYLPFNNLININRHKDGREVVIESSGKPIFDEQGQFRGYRGIDRDVTLRKKMEEDLRESKENLQNIFDTSPDWIWEVDLSGKHTYSNQSLFHLLGYHPEEFVGKDYFDFLHAEDSQKVKKVLPKLIAEKQGWNGWILRWRHMDGSYRFLESNAKPIINSAGELVGYRGIDRDITERKAMEENYRLLTRLTSDYVHYCTRSGRSKFQVQWIGGAISPISGYNIKEVLALGCFLPMIHPDDRQRVSDYLLNLVPGDRKSIEFRIVTQDQEIRWVSEKSHCIAGQFDEDLILLGAVTDITERKRSEMYLQESEERFRNIAEMLPEVVFELDLGGNIKFCSKKAFEIFGYSEEDLSRGLNALDMIFPEERALASERIRQRLTGEVIGATEYTALRKDGSTFPVLLNAVPIMKGGEPVGILGIMTDITEQKAHEMALLSATQAAEEANRAKDLFLAKMSHEIRTPLTTIVGFGELLEEAELSPGHKNYLAAINASGSSLAALIDDILDLTKAESRKLAIKPQSFCLRSLINKLVATQKMQIEKKNLSVSISIGDDVPDLLVADSLRIQQVLLNLLVNAIKFTDKGEIGITASLVEESGDRVLLEIGVQDTGIGIPDDLQDHIFEPFAQAPGSKNSKYGGSGLGLTISRSLAALMGGTIRVKSQKDVGSTFYLLLPAKGKSDNLAKKVVPEREPSLWNGPALKILLAEDNAVNSHFIKTVLMNMGHAITVVENGNEALDALEKNHFDLMLMDIQMPVMSGVDVLNVIRKLELRSGKHQKIIALTAYALIGDKEKYLKMGFDGYLSKPFKTTELMNEMARVVLP
jgi:PAS domain S-box-containing protein